MGRVDAGHSIHGSMNLTPAHIVELSRLLDEALTLQPDQRDAWLAALEGSRRQFLPALQDMLARHSRLDEHPLLATLPRLSAPEAEVARAGDLIGPYRLLRPLGRGGMAVVWLAERADEGVKRQVAIKLPLLTLSTPQQLERFTRERDVLATLEHAHIARLYEAGVSPTGQPYLVLEYVNGLPLTQHCDERRLGLVARLRLFLQVLAAVEHAHKHLVVHRDLKPSNILVDPQGQVKLLDFGIAKLLPDPTQARSRAQTTQQGAWALTPLYAAPEQLQGQAITTAADVYALGVLLYELMTGEWPYSSPGSDPEGASRQVPRSLPDLMHTVLNLEPTRPSAGRLREEAAQQRDCGGVKKLQALLRGDLDTVVLKALRKLPAQRYGSPERFADDLQSFLHHRPIAARPPTWLHGLHLFMRRHRGAALATGAGALAALVLSGVAWQQHRQSVEHRERAVAMHEFMFDLVDAAEPDENQPDAPITAQQMLDGAVKRARGSYGDKPLLQGELLSELGHMYHRLGEPAMAQDLQLDALELLQTNALDSDPALNKARARLADALVEYGAEPQWDHAMHLAQTAIDRCRSSDEACARVRTYALGAIASFHGLHGRYDAALTARRRIVREATQGFGPAHNETVQSLNDMVVEARNAGRLLEADHALKDLLAATRSHTLRSVVRRNVQFMAATLDADLGRYESARSQLQTLIATSPGTSGPPRQDRWRSRPGDQLINAYRMLAKVLFLMGDPVSARQAADASVSLVRPEQPRIAGLYARLIRAQVSSVLDLPDRVLEELQSIIQGLRDIGQPPEAGPVLLARQVRGEVLARAGRLGPAREDMEAVVAALARSAQPDAVQRAQALDQLGAILRELGLSRQAQARHSHARALMHTLLPAEHPLLARNALYLAAARIDALGGEELPNVRHEAERYKRLYPDQSVWREAVDRYLETLEAQPGPAAALRLLL